MCVEEEIKKKCSVCEIIRKGKERKRDRTSKHIQAQAKPKQKYTRREKNDNNKERIKSKGVE